MKAGLVLVEVSDIGKSLFPWQLQHTCSVYYKSHYTPHLTVLLNHQ